MGVVVKRFDIHLVSLDPTIGSEIQKTRPCVVVTPDEINRHIATIIVAPMTTRGMAYSTRVFSRFQGKQGQIILDQLRAVDKSRLVKRMGRLGISEQEQVLATLADMFAE